MTSTLVQSPEKATNLDVRVGLGRTSRPAEGQVRCKREGEQVILSWVCGASRSFTLEDATFALENLERLVGYDDAVFKDVDSLGATFYARVVDGRFYANDGRAPDLEGDYHVPWLAFRNAVLKAIDTKESKKRAATLPEPISEEDWRRKNE